MRKNWVLILFGLFLVISIPAQTNKNQRPRRVPETTKTETKPNPTEKTSEDEEVLRVDTQLVAIPTLVTDSKGKPISNLTANNFIVYEDGVKQDLENFGTMDAPFEVALLLDTSGSTRADLELIKKAAASFIASLRSGDRVSIISFKSTIRDNKRVSVVEMLNELTDDREVLKQSLDTINISNGTPFYDGLVEISKKIFNTPPRPETVGRRAVVALTDGVDSVSENDFDEARTDLQKTGVTSYFIVVNTQDFFEQSLLGDCEDETTVRFSRAQLRRYQALFPKGKAPEFADYCQIGQFELLDISKRLYDLARSEMKQIAQNSGGKTFPIANLTEAKKAFTEVANEIGTQYSLGYYSSNVKRDGSYRKIKVELRGVQGAKVQAREGYIAPKD
jgi:VWFA-related protein